MSTEKKLSLDLCNASHKVLTHKDFSHRDSVGMNGAEIGFSEASSPMDYALQDGMSMASSVINGHPDKGSNSQGTTKSGKKFPSFIFKPKVAPIQSTIYQMPLQKSLAYPKRLNWMSDLGIYFSHRFKLSFGPKNTLIVPISYNNVDREMKSKSYRT